MGIINQQNGNFQITDKIIVGKDNDYSDILRLAPTNKTWDIKNGYKWIYFNDVEIDKLFFHIGVCFHNDRLFCIDFNFTDKKEQNLTWDNWNEEDELKRKDNYDKWLTKIIGKKRNFEWEKLVHILTRKVEQLLCLLNINKKRTHIIGLAIWRV